MDWIIWFFIGLGIALLGIFVLGFIILYRVSNKNKIRINILLKSRQWARFKVKLKTVGKEIEFNDARYVFDDRSIIKGKYCDNVYYYEGNPEPIIFDFISNKPKVQAQDLQTILDSDLIEKLFSEERLKKMEMLLIIILIVVVVNLLATAGGFVVKPDIATEGNAEFIANITRGVILGG